VLPLSGSTNVPGTGTAVYLTTGAGTMDLALTSTNKKEDEVF